MDKLFKMTLLTSTVVAVLLLTWVLTKVGQHPICINSSLVDSMDIQSHEAVLKIKPCSFLESSDVPKKFQFYSSRINAAAAHIPSILDSTGKKLRVRPIRITVEVDHPFALAISQNHISIGRDLFESAGQIEKALLDALLLQNANQSFIESRLAREIVVDATLLLTTGDLNIYDPLTNHNTRGLLKFDHNHLKAFHNLKSLCTSAWRPQFLTDSCLDRKILNDEAFSKFVSSWSLRPLIGLVIQREITYLSLREKQKLLQTLLDRVESYDWNLLPQSSEKIIEVMISNAGAWSELLGFKGEILEALIEQIKNPDLLIIEDRQNLSVELAILQQMTLSNKIIFVSENNKMSFYPTGPKFKVESKVQPAHLILHSDKSLTVSSFNNLVSKDQRVLQILDEDKIELRSYFKDGIKGWIDANPKTSFRVFHLPSLRLANKWGLLPTQVFDKQNPALRLSPKFKTLFGLAHPQFIVRTNVNYVPGPLSVIEWFR